MSDGPGDATSNAEASRKGELNRGRKAGMMYASATDSEEIEKFIALSDLGPLDPDFPRELKGKSSGFRKGFVSVLRQVRDKVDNPVPEDL